MPLLESQIAFRRIIDSIKSYGDLPSAGHAFGLSKMLEKKFNDKSAAEPLRVDSTSIFSYVMHKNDSYADFSVVGSGVYSKYYNAFLTIACEIKSDELDKLFDTFEKQKNIIGKIKGLVRSKTREELQAQIISDTNAQISSIVMVFDYLPEFERIFAEIKKNPKRKLSEEDSAVIETISEAFHAAFDGFNLKSRHILTSNEKQIMSELFDQIEVANGREKQNIYEKLSEGNKKIEQKAVDENILNVEEFKEEQQNNGQKYEEITSIGPLADSVRLVRNRLAIVYQNLDEAMRVGDIEQVEVCIKKLGSYIKQIDTMQKEHSVELADKPDLKEALDSAKRISDGEIEWAGNKKIDLKKLKSQSETQALYLPDNILHAGSEDEISKLFNSKFESCLNTIKFAKLGIEVGVDDYDQAIKNIKDQALEELENIKFVGGLNPAKLEQVDEKIAEARLLISQLENERSKRGEFGD